MSLSRVPLILLVMMLPVVTFAQREPLTASPMLVPDFRLVVLGHFDAGVMTMAIMPAEREERPSRSVQNVG